MYFSALFVLYPYLTIHMRELGINVEETAVMNAVTPVIAIIMPPLAGMFADRIGNFRIMLCFFSSLGGVASLLLLLVPVGRVTMSMPSSLPLALGCGEINADSVSPLQLTMLPDPPCTLLPNMNQSLSLKLETCGLVCSAPASIMEGLLNVPAYRVTIEGQVNDFWYTPRQPQPDIDFSKITDPRNIPANPPQYYNVTIRKIAEDHVFFPTPTLFNVTCLRDRCYFMEGDVSFTNATRSTTDSFFAKKFNVKRVTDSLNETIASIYSDHRISKRNVHVSPMFELKHRNSSFRCEDPMSQRDISIGVPTLQRSNLRSCRPICIATAPRSALCKEEKKIHIYDPSLTFWSYMTVRVVIGVIGGTAFAMFEGAVIATLREYRADYGLQRIYATIGGMISSPLAGLLIDYVSRGKDYTDFRPAFYLYAVLKVVGGLLMLTIRLDFKSPAPGVVRDMIKVLKNVEITALLLACFLLGTAWGYLESFLFWLLQDLGGSRLLMGLTITVGGLAGLPLLALSGPIIEALGHANVICLGFVFYAVRLVGYSLLWNPWLCLLFEAMEGVTSSLTFTAVVTYGARLSNPSTDSSVQGLIGGIYYGVGKGGGSLIGGFLIKAVGARPTYQLFAVASAGFSVIYFLFHKYVTLKRPQRKINDIMKPTEREIQMENGGTKVAAEGGDNKVTDEKRPQEDTSEKRPEVTEVKGDQEAEKEKDDSKQQ
ncbi:hypothetical protein B566_EDAN003134 [Ephemera danica]|nr:hypothetical protein B566_EDAN003134 [Ephemera danica]